MRQAYILFISQPALSGRWHSGAPCVHEVRAQKSRFRFGLLSSAVRWGVIYVKFLCLISSWLQIEPSWEKRMASISWKMNNYERTTPPPALCFLKHHLFFIARHWQHIANTNISDIRLYRPCNTQALKKSRGSGKWQIMFWVEIPALVLLKISLKSCSSVMPENVETQSWTAVTGF